MWVKKVISIVLGLFIAFVLCEIILKIYNPFQSRIRGNEIILKSNFKKTVEIEPRIKGLDKQIIYSTNSLGFRGPEPPSEWANTVTLLTVGGSTTECSLLSDDSTWPSKLFMQLQNDNPSLWMNNAGLDGCSTYGHLILMRDYIVKLKPNYVLFLVGINDLVKSNFSNEDGFLIKRKEVWWRTLFKKSELLTTISNVMESIKSQKANVSHGSDPYDYKNNDLNTTDSSLRKKTEENLKTFIPEYINRIKKLTEICQTNNIKPIFITQPKFDDTLSYSWQVMKRYNDALIEYCQYVKVDFIDLGSTMPKKLEYYYDQIHFTNAGAEKIAQILSPQIQKILNKK